MRPSERFRPSLALLTDLYQLTMAYGYWKAGMAERRACFHLFFRQPPFGGQYAVAAGIPDALGFLEDLAFDDEDLDYLAGLQSPNGHPMFERGFIDHLQQLRFRGDVDAVTEGTVLFGHEPLMRVQAPLLQSQLVETPLLDLTGFATLVATKAARVCEAAAGAPVLEFGLRRAQGPDGALTASRAAYIGGCAATSNVLAGRLYGIPVKGTHAHSWVMAFGDEQTAFNAWADAMPDNTIFLVDTYDSLQGVHHAIEAGRRLRENGYELQGIRLDSGDLGGLSKKARTLLDEAGFDHAAIVGSGDLDEHSIAALRRDNAPIGVWGVGTRLATAYDEPALGVVYKLSAIESKDGRWQSRVKLSESGEKSTVPGLLQVRRFREAERLIGDAIYDLRDPPSGEWTMVSPVGAAPEDAQRWSPPASASAEDLLQPALRDGRSTTRSPSTSEARQRALAQLGGLPAEVRALREPIPYPVGLEAGLHALDARLKGRQ